MNWHLSQENLTARPSHFALDYRKISEFVMIDGLLNLNSFMKRLLFSN